ncbi:MAG: hypothetical protein C1943_05765 [Halochromatium sp.]|nr:hypothetical protein [Halochromatium sp.]
MNIDQRVRDEWRSIKIEKISDMTELRCLESKVNELSEMAYACENGRLVKDAGFQIWRAKVGRGAEWHYATTLEEAISKALDNATTQQSYYPAKKYRNHPFYSS